LPEARPPETGFVAEPGSGPLHTEDLSIEVVTRSGRAAGIVIRVLADRVEFWRDDHCVGRFNREHLRGWLTAPHCAIRVGTVTLSQAPESDRTPERDDRVAISLPDVPEWAFSPRSLDDLRRCIR
jgi:hypothetical protein